MLRQPAAGRNRKNSFHRSGAHCRSHLCRSRYSALVPHDIFPIGNMTGFPALKDNILAEQWQDKRVWDAGKIT